MSAASEEPILSRLNRLDLILKQLEEISPKSSSYASTNSSGTLTSDGRPDWSPERRCRPLDDVMLEVQQKGNLIDRLAHAEDRILKVCLQLEQEFQEISGRSKSPKKGLKHFVKSCVKPNHKTTIFSS